MTVIRRFPMTDETPPAAAWPTAKNANIKLYVPFNDASNPTTSVIPAGKSWNSTTNLTFGDTGLLDKSIKVTGAPDNSITQAMVMPQEGKLSLSLWINCAGTAISGNREFTAWSYNDGTYRYDVTVYATATRLYVRYVKTLISESYTDTDATAYATVTIPSTGWHHIVVVTQAADATIYVDDTPYTTTKNTWSSRAEGTFASSTVVHLHRMFYVIDQSFLGNKEQLVVWADRLTAEEVTAIYNGGAGVAYEA